MLTATPKFDVASMVKALTRTIEFERELTSNMKMRRAPEDRGVSLHSREASDFDMDQQDLVENIKLKYACFPEVDHRILTNWGFLFLDQIEALLSVKVEVLYGCYDVTSKALSYTTGTLALPSERPKELLEFATVGEAARWSEGSDDFGVVEQQRGRRNPHVSLVVTSNHRMFVQTGNENRHGVVKVSQTSLGGRGAQVRTDRPPREEYAVDLLSTCHCPPTIACAHRRAGLRMTACAEAGSTAQSTLQRHRVQRALSLDDTQFLHFIELLGFWLGDGSMSYKGEGGGQDDVCFTLVKRTDRVWLKRLLPKVGLRPSQLRWWEGVVQERLCIIDPAWFAFFDKEFGAKYTGSRYYRPPAAVPSASSPSAAASASPAARSLHSSSSPSSPSSSSVASSTRSRASSACSGSGSGVGMDLFSMDRDAPEEEEKVPPPPAGFPPGWMITWGPGVLPPETTKSVKHLPDWTLAELSRDEMRLLIRGLHRADGHWKKWVKKVVDNDCEDEDAEAVEVDNGGDDEDGPGHRPKKIYTSSARFRDELMQALLHCGHTVVAALHFPAGAITGYVFHDQVQKGGIVTLKFFKGLTANEQRLYKEVKATTEVWTVCWAAVEADGPTLGAATASLWPAMNRQQCVKRVPYSAALHKRIWCVAVDHPDHLIVAQRARRDPLTGDVTKQTRPIIVGNSKKTKDGRGGRLESPKHVDVSGMFAKDGEGKAGRTALPPIDFHGAISDAFTPYMGAYVDLERKRMSELMEKVEKEERWTQPDESKAKDRYGCSDDLFLYIKNSITQCNKLNRNEILYNLFLEYRRGLSLYCDMLDRHTSKKESLSEREVQMTCYTVNTAEYCADTIPQLELSIKNSIDAAYKEKVDLSGQQELYNVLINKVS